MTFPSFLALVAERKSRRRSLEERILQQRTVNEKCSGNCTQLRFLADPGRGVQRHVQLPLKSSNLFTISFGPRLVLIVSCESGLHTIHPSPSSPFPSLPLPFPSSSLLFPSLPFPPRSKFYVSLLSGSCSFDLGTCGWENDQLGDSLYWKLAGSQRRAFPEKDHGGKLGKREEEEYI